MRDRMCEEPMCETSERGEKLIERDEILPLSLEIGRRMMELFGYQSISKIVFRLKSNSREIEAIINGEDLPSTELLLGLHKATGVSIDWLLTGTGAKFAAPLQISDHSRVSPPAAIRFANKEGERSITLKAA